MMKNTRGFFFFDNRTKNFINLHNGLVFGREEGECRFPSDGLMSRRHCQIWIEKDAVYIEDLGSTNTTKVNYAPLVPSKRRRIQLNDVIEFGNQRMTLTNQNNHSPGGIEPRASRSKRFSVVRRSDGKLTTDFSKRIINQTKMVMNWSGYARVKIQEQARSSDFSIRIVSAVTIILWLNWLRLLIASKALEDGLRNSVAILLATFGLTAIVSSCTVIIIHHRIVKRLKTRPLLRAALIPISLSAFILLWSALDSTCQLTAKTDENITYLHCVKKFDAKICAVHAKPGLQGYSRLPEEIRDIIKRNMLLQGYR